MHFPTGHECRRWAEVEGEVLWGLRYQGGGKTVTVAQGSG